GDYIVIATTYDGWFGGDYQLNVYAETHSSDDDVDDTDDTRYSGNFAFSIINLSGDDVCGIFISASDADDWGDNWLGDVLADGDNIAVELPSDNYDLLIYDCYEDGMMWEAYYISLTSNLSYVVTPDGGYVSK
ncbi:MAG: hypothetical protein CUN52_15345, partial [Phototrophicales bacterium]